MYCILAINVHKKNLYIASDAQLPPDIEVVVKDGYHVRHCEYLHVHVHVQTMYLVCYRWFMFLS